MSNTKCQPAAVAHGGVGTPAADWDGCQLAVDAALVALAAGADPLDAAVAGTVLLEDDPRFNAGTGSVVRLDGSVQMDASAMDSDGRFGAVAAVERVRNPVKVARAVVDTPHLLLAGDGACQLARVLGLGDYDPATEEQRAATEKIKLRLRGRAVDLPPFWRGPAWRRLWNYAQPPDHLGLGEEHGDTVGVVVRAADGRFAAALSTGGTALMLRGRVGDVPVFGAGLYAGPHGAAAATGIGERIVERLLAHTVRGWLGSGVPAQEAADRAVAHVGTGAPIGIVIVTAGDLAAAADRPMAWAGREAGGPWLGPGV
jgi:isoaspartyl peptidase/L-asparaginase-like protein (Ntn-hydrolase superfamily)